LSESSPVEFTGERVIPGQVNEDLWAEHLSRYAFARRYAAGKRVLDAGCGTGYGTVELARDAASVIGVDFSVEAIEFASTNYPLPSVRFQTASCLALPFADSSFELVVAFEVIEHLAEYRRFLDECARVLTPDGILIVSTPNKRYYTESRGAAGANPYHEHEFEADEFQAELNRRFPHVSLLVQNRAECFAFYPVKIFWPVEARLDATAGSADQAHFFIAVCSRTSLPEQRSLVYVPKAANLLREREQHIRLLETQLQQSRDWLKETQDERGRLLEICRKQQQELEQSNLWAQKLNSDLEASYRELKKANQCLDNLQAEHAVAQRAAAETMAAYEAKVQELDAANLEKTNWALQNVAELEARTNELIECGRLLSAAEATVEERTHWAQDLDSQRELLAAQVRAVQASRWIKLGRKFGVGPAIETR